jgi:hypothetical protein
MSDANESDLKRRRQPRRPVTVLVDVEGSGAPTGVTALISDLSVGGAKFLTNAPFKIADAVALRIRLDNVSPDSPTIDTKGKVVRVEPLGRNRVGLWSHAVAVQFERELNDHRSEIEKLAALVRPTNGARE